MSDIMDRFEDVLASVPPLERMGMRWRLSRDVFDECLVSIAHQKPGASPRGVQIMGYDVIVEEHAPAGQIAWDPEGGRIMPDIRAALHAAIDDMPAAATLDAAWAEAEAALPAGMTFSLTRAVRPASEGAAPTYYATASRPWTSASVEFQVSGPTPAAALRALAERLRRA